MFTNGYGDTSKANLLNNEELEQSVVITDPSLPDNPMIFITSEFEKQTGYAPDETLGQNCRFLQGTDTNPDTVEKIRSAIKQEDALEIDILNYKKDGTKFWNRLRIRPWFGDDGKVMFYIGAQNPITDPNTN